MNEGGLYCVVREKLGSTGIVKVNTELTRLVYPSNTCNSPSVTSFSIQNYPYLESIEVGDDCFLYVKTVTISDNTLLKTVTIGSNSFTNQKRGYSQTSDRIFTLKNCPQLTEFSVNRYSFSDYSTINLSGFCLSVILILALPSLQLLTFGVLDEESFNFYYASLQLQCESGYTHSS